MRRVGLPRAEATRANASANTLRSCRGVIDWAAATCRAATRWLVVAVNAALAGLMRAGTLAHLNGIHGIHGIEHRQPQGAAATPLRPGSGTPKT